MAVKSITPILDVESVPSSFAWFERLGRRRGFRWNDGGMIPNAGDRNEHGDAGFGSLVTLPQRGEPWAVREFHLRHTDGHMFRVSAGLAAE
jgi:hypothetical protein